MIDDYYFNQLFTRAGNRFTKTFWIMYEIHCSNVVDFTSVNLLEKLLLHEKNRPIFYKFYSKFKAFSWKAKSVTLIYCYFNYPPIKKVLNLEISPGQKKTFVVFT